MAQRRRRRRQTSRLALAFAIVTSSSVILFIFISINLPNESSREPDIFAESLLSPPEMFAAAMRRQEKLEKQMGHDTITKDKVFPQTIHESDLKMAMKIKAAQNDGHAGKKNVPITESTTPTYEIAKASTHTCFDGTQNVTIPKAPTFLIIGSQKSGTSSMFTYLLEHPNVVPTLNYLEKNTTEMHFFDWHYVKKSGPYQDEYWNQNNLHNDEEFDCLMRQHYVDMFPKQDLMNAATVPCSPLKMAFEKTPIYLFLPYVPLLIQRTVPWAKMIVLLRNPVDRAYSHHWFHAVHEYSETGRILESFELRINQELEFMRQWGLTTVPNMTLEDALHFDKDFPPNNQKGTRAMENRWFYQNVEGEIPDPSNLLRGLYAIQLRQWLQYFPSPEKTLVLKYDDLQNDSRAVYQRILKHVGLPPHNLQSVEKRLHHSTWYPPMRNGTRAFLTKFYEPYNAQLADLLGDEWRGVWT